jgi:hypothetical protein
MNEWPPIFNNTKLFMKTKPFFYSISLLGWRDCSHRRRHFPFDRRSNNDDNNGRRRLRRWWWRFWRWRRRRGRWCRWRRWRRGRLGIGMYNSYVENIKILVTVHRKIIDYSILHQFKLFYPRKSDIFSFPWFYLLNVVILNFLL